jgi:uncharacterized membrane protein YeaQ/YmgE (transglycosylase-associated protein family)
VSAGNVFSAILVGLVIGALGRLVVPGRQPIGCLLTLLLGIVGAVGGAALGRAADVDGWLVFVLQVAVAAVGVAVVAAALRGPRRPPMVR